MWLKVYRRLLEPEVFLLETKRFWFTWLLQDLKPFPCIWLSWLLLCELLVIAFRKISLNIPCLLCPNPDMCVCLPLIHFPWNLWTEHTNAGRKKVCMSIGLNLLLGGWLAVSSRELLFSSFRLNCLLCEAEGKYNCPSVFPRALSASSSLLRLPKYLLTSQRYLEHIYLRMCPYGIPGLLDRVWRNMCTSS